MRTTYLVLFLVLLTQGLFAQEPCRSYNSITDLLNGTYDTTLSVIVEKRTKNQIFMSGGADYKIYNGDKETDKLIKTKIYAIEVNDSLYVNCRKLKFKKHVIGAWFAPAIVCQGKVYFYAISVGPSAAVAFGVIGGAVQAANEASSRVYYEMDPAMKELDKVGSEKMMILLKDYPELLEQYKKEALKEHIEIVHKYLQKINQLNQ